MKITGAIFDMDGTLLDSMDYWGIAAGEYLKHLGIEVSENVDKYFLEEGIRAWYDYCVEKYALGEPFEVAKAWIYEFMNQRYRTVVKDKEGAREMLERLHSAGVKMCLATATNRPTVEMILERLSLGKYFDRAFTCGEVGVGKREPLIYNLALEHLGTDKETTYVFEDAHYALKTAHEAGFKTVCIYDKNAYEPIEEMKRLCDLYLSENDKYRFDFEV